MAVTSGRRLVSWKLGLWTLLAVGALIVAALGPGPTAVTGERRSDVAPLELGALGARAVDRELTVDVPPAIGFQPVAMVARCWLLLDSGPRQPRRNAPLFRIAPKASPPITAA